MHMSASLPNTPELFELQGKKGKKFKFSLLQIMRYTSGNNFSYFFKFLIMRSIYSKTISIRLLIGVNLVYQIAVYFKDILALHKSVRQMTCLRFSLQWIVLTYYKSSIAQYWI